MYLYWQTIALLQRATIIFNRVRCVHVIYFSQPLVLLKKIASCWRLRNVICNIHIIYFD